MNDPLLDWMQRHPGMVPEPPMDIDLHSMSNDDIMDEIELALLSYAQEEHVAVLNLVNVLYQRAKAEE